jgi:bacillithiol biosynthesis deacetylase BshB1
MSHDFEALCLGPHPDDAEIGCGGTILRLIAAGEKVAIVDMTRGEMGTRGDAKTRQRECEAATTVLGVAERTNLELPDTRLRADDDEMVAKVIAEIRRLRPRLFFAPHERDVHPDHVAAAHIARRAFFLAGLAKYGPELGAPFRPTVAIRYPGNNHVDPDFCVDISDFVPQKKAAIECYATQVNIPGAEKDGAHFAKKIDPLDRCMVRDRYFGAQVGCRAAEPFVVDGPLLIHDLGSLFRR